MVCSPKSNRFNSINEPNAWDSTHKADFKWKYVHCFKRIYLTSGNWQVKAYFDANAISPFDSRVSNHKYKSCICLPEIKIFCKIIRLQTNVWKDKIRFRLYKRMHFMFLAIHSINLNWERKLKWNTIWNYAQHWAQNSLALKVNLGAYVDGIERASDITSADFPSWIRRF